MYGLWRPKRRKSAVFSRFLVSYLALLVLPVVLFSYIVSTTTKKIEQNAIEQSTSLLIGGRNQIDHQMRSLYNGVIGINYNTLINRVLDSEKVHDVADVMLSFKDLSAFEQEHNRLYVYANSIDSLLSTNGCYNRIEQIYGTVLAYGDMNYSQFHDLILEGRHNGRFLAAQDAIIDSQPTRAILYMQSIPIGTRGQVQGNILYFVQENAVLEPLQGLRRPEGGWVSITTAQGEVISGFGAYPENLADLVYQSSKTNVVYSGDLILVSTRSAYNGWQYTAAIPKDYILKESNSVRITVLVLFGLYMLLGVCFSCFIAMRNFKPLQELTELIREGAGDKDKRGNEYDLLREYVEDLTSSNRNLETSLDSYAKAMESTQITSLICGRYDTPAELEEFAVCKHIMGHTWFTVVLVDFFPRLTLIDQSVLDALVVRRLMAKQALADLQLEGLALGEIDVNKIGLLFYSNAEPALDEVLCRLEKILSLRLEGQVCIGVGSSCKRLGQISFSNLQADCALRAALTSQVTMLHFSQIPHNPKSIYFPENIRASLLQAVTGGNIKQAKSTLKLLDLENFTARTLSPKETGQMISQMKQLFKALPATEPPQVPPALEGLVPQEQFAVYAAALLRICSQNTDGSETRNSKLHEEILSFVNDNYFDSGLCLSKLATRFNLSEAYLSYLFKKMLGVNFSSYLEEKRIAKATEMLQRGDCSIEEVAAQVGYNSPHAFRRAFKKAAGINPRDIRKQSK